MNERDRVRGGGAYAERRRENHRKMFKESYRSNTDTERIAYKNIDSETLGSMAERERKREKDRENRLVSDAFSRIYRNLPFHEEKKTPRFPIFYL